MDGGQLKPMLVRFVCWKIVDKSHLLQDTSQSPLFQRLCSSRMRDARLSKCPWTVCIQHRATDGYVSCRIVPSSRIQRVDVWTLSYVLVAESCAAELNNFWLALAEISLRAVNFAASADSDNYDGVPYFTCVSWITECLYGLVLKQVKVKRLRDNVANNNAALADRALVLTMCSINLSVRSRREAHTGMNVDHLMIWYSSLFKQVLITRRSELTLQHHPSSPLSPLLLIKTEDELGWW